MVINYKGFEIEVSRDDCLAGHSMIYYSIFTADGTELDCGFSDTEDTVLDYIEFMKNRVDEYLEDSELYTYI